MIDPRAVVDAAASLASDVTIGPFSVIGADVAIAEGTWVGPHVVIEGPTSIGRNNRIYQFASVGDRPQDKKYGGEPTRLEIGDGNVIREYCTINRGTVQDAGVTRIGNDNWVMAYVHIAHDCQVGNRIVLANGVTLGGHVKIGDDATLGGFTLVHQFCRIGAYSFCAFGSGVNQDVPPFVTVAGHRAEPHGINTEGLRRRGFPVAEINALRQAYKAVYRSQLRLEEAVAEVRKLVAEFPRLSILMDFFAAPSSRGIVR